MSISPSSSSSSSSPVLGSAYLSSQAELPPASPTELSPSLCLNLTLFKATLRRYRALDDSIIVRLNRDAALHRGQTGGEVLDVERDEGARRTCLRVWREIIESWKRREAVVRYCVSTVDDRLLARDREIRDAGGNEEFERLDRDRARSVREGIYLEETKRQQLHNELSVESIIRRRTLTAFFSRCPTFTPPSGPSGEPFSMPTVDLEPMPMPRRPINN